MNHRIESFGRARGMRLSLLASLGLLPIACGGSAVIDPSGRASDGTGAKASQGGSAGASPAAVDGGAAQTTGGITATTGGATTTGGAGPTAGGATTSGGATTGGAGPTAGGVGPSAGGTIATTGGTGPTAGAGPGSAGASPIYPGPTKSGDGVPACDAPTIEPVTHLVRCANGYSHRPEATTCQVAVDVTGAAGAGGASDGAVPLQCSSDADCSALPLGYCNANVPGISGCRSGCRQDSDCASQQICLCDGSAHGGICAEASCSTDSDCGPGGRCAEQTEPCSPPVFLCQKPSDHCEDPSCNKCLDGFASKQCYVCGRPFLVLEAARVAPVVARADWLETALPAPSLHGLSDAQRGELAAHWARLGQMEHASIAAFARFQLQLLSLGAPAELIEACTRALADETAHTKLCFALASHYAGSALGPSRLDVSDCLRQTTLSEIMMLVFHEGALGETAAALEAAVSADVASDPAIQQLYARIARDEQRHAELAYRFLAWALTRASDAEREEFSREANRAVEEAGRARKTEPASERESREEHGILAASTRRAVQQSAARAVTGPLLVALLRAPAYAAMSTRAQPEMSESEIAAA